MNIFISLFILGRFACRAFGILFLCSLRTAIFLSPSSPAFSSLPLSISIVSYHVFIHYASPSSLCSSSFSSTLPVPLLPQSLPTLLSSNFHYTTRLNCCSFILCLFYPVSVYTIRTFRLSGIFSSVGLRQAAYIVCFGPDVTYPGDYLEYLWI